MLEYQNKGWVIQKMLKSHKKRRSRHAPGRCLKSSHYIYYYPIGAFFIYEGVMLNTEMVLSMINNNEIHFTGIHKYDGYKCPRYSPVFEQLKGNRYVPQDVRIAVVARDKGKCTCCNSRLDLQFDHIIPYSKGGEATVENIQLLCRPCNRKNLINRYLMAKFRKIHTSFWGDEFVANLTPEQKYFYLYLLTNNNTRQCGIYEISKRIMCFDTGYNIDTVSKLLTFFEQNKKIVLSQSTNEIVILNWLRYNDSTSPKVQQCIKTELKTVKNKQLIEYLYSIDTQSQKEGELRIRKEEEEEGVAPPPVVFLIIEEIKKHRPELPEDVLQKEASRMMIKKPDITPAKYKSYIRDWAAKINHTPVVSVDIGKQVRIEKYNQAKKDRRREYELYGDPTKPFIDVDPKDYGL